MEDLNWNVVVLLDDGADDDESTDRVRVPEEATRPALVAAVRDVSMMNWELIT